MNGALFSFAFEIGIFLGKRSSGKLNAGFPTITGLEW
jgi:hypothetical protein